MRAAIRQAMPGQARFVISAVFGMAGVKHVIVTDDGIDVRNDQEVEWALSTRFRLDRDLVVERGFPAYYADPTAADSTVAKIGFDATHGPAGDSIEERRDDEGLRVYQAKRQWVSCRRGKAAPV